jgi:putative DNA methylase
MDRYCKRLIEVDLPIKRISAHARREKSVRHGHISTLHIWWARRPLAACRAVICAALWPDPADELCPESFRESARNAMSAWSTEHLKLAGSESAPRFLAIQRDPTRLSDNKRLRRSLLDFIADFANWDSSYITAFAKTSHLLTDAANAALGNGYSKKPLVLDPFAGGGAIPLEALRVGADAYGSDINPVAFLLNKVMLQYGPKYGKSLADGVREWGKALVNKVSAFVDCYYPADADGSLPVAYLWARTVRCEGPGCGVEIPLLRSTTIAQRGATKISLELVPDPVKKHVGFRISEDVGSSSDGTVRRSSAVCPCCGYTTPAQHVRDQFKERRGGANDARLIAVVTTSRDQTRKSYRVANDADLAAVAKARTELQRRISGNEDLQSLVPEEELPYLRSIFNIHLLGVHRWCDLFTDRQLLILTALWKHVREGVGSVGRDADFSRACATCVALAVDRLSAQYTSLSWWQPKGEFVVGTFGRQALGIIWDFAEIRPVGGASGDLDGAFDWVVRVLDNLLAEESGTGHVELTSATDLPLPDDSVAAVVTDPPYYDAVPYANLSDFFYTQLKRMLSDYYPDVFAGVLAPKEGEIVQLAERNKMYAYKTKEYFERLMSDALTEARRVLEPSGVSVIVFAHKTTSGWEAMLSALVESGWVVTASWPIDTERAVRMRAQRSAALGSSVHLVCRPREEPDGSLRTSDVGDWRDVLAELPRRIHEWLPQLADEGIVGADAIFSCLGPALEVFSRYSSVEKPSGVTVPLGEYLKEVWAAVSREALNMIFEGAETSGFEEDARLTAMWLWTLHTAANGDEESEGDDKRKSLRGYDLEYDAARKIAQGLGVHLENLGHLVELKGDTATLLSAGARTKYLFGSTSPSGPKKRPKKKDQLSLNFTQEIEELEEENAGWAGEFSSRPEPTLLDQVHQAMILFGASRGEALRRLIVDDGVGSNLLFWRLAQALTALYPGTTEEKRWIDGVLARKKGFGF